MPVTEDTPRDYLLVVEQAYENCGLGKWADLSEAEKDGLRKAAQNAIDTQSDWGGNPFLVAVLEISK